jgi:alginate O-acetyltransferase complex protein AlgI
MLFNSTLFLYAFLPITYLIFWALKEKNQRYGWLVIASYIFYGYWNYKFCALMAFSTLVSFFSGLALGRSTHPSRRRFYMTLAVGVDLSMLGFFKYTPFILQTARHIFLWRHIPAHFPVWTIVLPVGISFYTFHTISYVVDCYRRTIKPTRNFLEFACYVSLFSQLVAGPIVRFRQIETDLEHIQDSKPSNRADIGWSFFVIGMIKKVIVADTIAMIIDPALKSYQDLSTLGVWLCMLGFTYQLYFDFSGYSDMAVGLGHLFGLRLPKNFDTPYKAENPSDFWHRWHISLSTCLRDYLYIPLGGNRGSQWHVACSILITMLLGGLWHGAQWTFVIWGLYHGLLLLLYRLNAKRWNDLPAVVKTALTFLLVIIGWVFFRAENFSMACGLLRHMFLWQNGPLPVGMAVLSVCLIIAAGFAHGGRNTFELSHQWNPPMAVVLSLLFVTTVFLLYGNPTSPFLYFQF